MQTSLIRQVAIRRTPSDTRALHRYDPETKMSYIWESGGWILSTESSMVAETKKADRETGEDQKGA
jgi:hypothetical protein